MKKIILSIPMLLTYLLIAWTASVYQYSKYGSWHIYPALAIALLVVISHAVRIASISPRAPNILYAVVHLIFFVPLWLGCLMLISKDSI